MTILPTWTDRAAIDKIAADLRKGDEKAVQEAEAHKHALEEQAQQDELQRKNLGLAQQKQQDALREQYGAAARGLETALADSVKEHISQARASNADAVASMFPDFAKWYGGQQSRDWKLVADGFRSELVDYGTVQWNGRAVEAVLITATTKLSNADPGSYEDQCFVLGAAMRNSSGFAIPLRCRVLSARKRFISGR